jgi:predicted O-methyltransferase YrrM
MNKQRYTQSYTAMFFKYLLGLRPASTAVAVAEKDLLARLSEAKRCIVEVGVFEGVTSAIFCQHMDPRGRLYLIDPYFPIVRLEEWFAPFKFSCTEFIARRSVRRWKSQLEFVRMPSAEASHKIKLIAPADLIFIDARHDYASVREDFEKWAPRLAPEGIMAFHDSRISESRQDLTDETGPVRLVNEILRGVHGIGWELTAAADSLTAIRRRSRGA